jgi:hypothetical protein
MSFLNFEKLVREEFAKVDYPENPEIRFSQKGEKINVFIKPSEYDDDLNLNHSYVLFDIDAENRKITGLDILFQTRLRGQGYGRKTVEVIENIARKSNFVKIEADKFLYFLAKLGYVSTDQYMEKKI